MSRLGRAAARAAVALYPRGWRRRYEGELRALLEDTDPGVADAVDVAAGAMREHATGGTPVRFGPAHRHPQGFATAAMAILAPTLALVTLSVIGHELGVSSVAAAVDPVIRTVTAPAIVDVALVLAPLAALALAALPLFAVRFGAGDGGRSLTLQIQALPLNLAVAGLAVLLGAALAAHMLVEAGLHSAG